MEQLIALICLLPLGYLAYRSCWEAGRYLTHKNEHDAITKHDEFKRCITVVLLHFGTISFVLASGGALFLIMSSGVNFSVSDIFTTLIKFLVLAYLGVAISSLVPLFVRFVIMRRPFRKWWTTAIAMIPLWVIQHFINAIINFVIFDIPPDQAARTSGYYLWSLLVYTILRFSTRELPCAQTIHGEDKTEHEKTEPSIETQNTLPHKIPHWYYLAPDNTPVGPYFKTALVSLIEDGNITWDTYVWNGTPVESGGKWILARDSAVARTQAHLQEPDQS